MGETLKSLTSGKNFIRNVLAFLLISFTCTYFFVVTVCDIPKENLTHVNTIMGFLIGTATGGVVSFYFGSSQSSQEKSEIIKKM